MRCEKVKRGLSAFVDGEVKDKEKKKILAHLKTCSSCDQEAKTLFSLQVLLEEGKETIKIPPYFINKLEQKIAQLEEKKNAFGKLWERINQAFIPATTVAILIIGIFIGNHLGDVFYSGIAEILNFRDSSLIQEAVDQSLYLSSLDDFPPESLGGAYTALIKESQSPQ